MDLSNQTLGDFHLLRHLGQGAMGQVYLAEQISLRRKVAIKIMRPDLALDPVASQRFRAEAEAVARITHANIVQVYAFGEVGGRLYMALEYVEGRSLQEHLKAKGPVDLALALSIMRQVAAGLQRAAELGIIHRDIKPENILITRRGEVKLADFGLSRCFDQKSDENLTRPGVTVGTPLYMSPEQIEGREVDPRTDIYGFGATAYHMLAGEPPFTGNSAFEVAVQHLRALPRPLAQRRPSLPPELCEIIQRMMAKDVSQRYQSCAELFRDLTRLREILIARRQLAGTSSLALSTSQLNLPDVVPAPARKRGWTLTLAFLLSMVAATGLGGTLAWRHGNTLARQQSSLAAQPDPPYIPEMEKKETFLREAIAQDADPGSDRFRLNRGVTNRVELAHFYLHAHRLDDAEKFFAELQNSKVRAYAMLGKFGQAVVLAHRNRAQDSNRLFLELLGAKALVNPERERLLLDQAQLRAEIAEALDFNKANATAALPFPEELDVWRVPPANTRKGSPDHSNPRNKNGTPPAK